MLVLASNSPRRKQLLSLGGWEFTVQSAYFDESLYPAEKPIDYVLRLAAGKAQALQQQADLDPEAVIVAADTTVVDGNDILGKPVDAADAARMLQRLRGRVHQVYTGMAVLRVADGWLLQDVCRTDVAMRPYDDEEVSNYITSGDPLDKAGAYAIQHPVFQPAQALQGCYANVMGLPICHLTRLLERVGVSARSQVWQSCQEDLDTPCSIYRQVLGMDVV
jgi:septum formation protein